LEDPLFSWLFKLVKFIDQWLQGRYFMAKSEINSVDYNSLIGADFKNVTSTNQGVKHHVPVYFLVATALFGILIVSVVLAQSNQTSSSVSVTSNADVTTTEESIESNQTIALPLKPVTEPIQSQTLALQDPIDILPAENIPSENLQETIFTNEAIDEIETIAPEAIEVTSDVTVVVEKGDTLSSIFKNLDIHHELTRILNRTEVTFYVWWRWH